MKQLPAWADVTEGDLLKLAWGLIVSLVMAVCGFYTKSTRRELDEMKSGHDKLWEHHDEHAKQVATLEAEGRHTRQDLAEIKAMIRDMNQTVQSLHAGGGEPRRSK